MREAGAREGMRGLRVASAVADDSLDSDCRHHLGVDRTDIFIGTGLAELECEGVVLIERGGAEEAIGTDDGMGLSVQIFPGHRGAGAHGDRYRGEIEILHYDCIPVIGERRWAGCEQSY